VQQIPDIVVAFNNPAFLSGGKKGKISVLVGGVARSAFMEG